MIQKKEDQPIDVLKFDLSINKIIKKAKFLIDLAFLFTIIYLNNQLLPLQDFRLFLKFQIH